MADYIQIYEKKRRRTFILFCIVMLSIPIFTLIIYALAKNYGQILLYDMCTALLLATIYLKVEMRMMRENVSIITDIYKNELKVDLALEVFRQLLRKKRRRDYTLLLLNYLLLLLDTGKIDEFKKEYADNRKVIRNRRFDKSIQEKLLLMSDDKENRRNHIFQYRFSKYHNRIGKLSWKKSYLRRKDRLYEIMQLYELKEYKQAIEVIEQIPFENRYEALLYQSYKERCLYHLKEPYSVPDDTIYPFVFVTEWSSLVKTGEEFKYSNMNSIIDVINRDQVIAKKNIIIKQIILLTITLFCLLALLFFPNKEANREEHFAMLLDVQEYKVEEMYGTYMEDDIWAGVFFGTEERATENVIPTPYLSRISFFSLGGKEMMDFDIQPLTYDGGTDVYTSRNFFSTYVTVLTEQPAEILYDGKEIKNLKSEQLPAAPAFDAPYAYFFLLDGVFGEELLEIDGVFYEDLLATESEKDFMIDENPSSWEIKLTAKDAHEWGLFLVCAYKGDGTISHVHTGARYWIEEKTTEGWKKIEIYEDEEMWKPHKYYFDSNPVQTLEIYWGNVYWKLSSGKYRMGKDFTWYDEVQGMEVTQPFYAEFEVK